MYTIEVAGKPIAVANIGLQAEAEEFFNSDWFKEEMLIFEAEDGATYGMDRTRSSSGRHTLKRLQSSSRSMRKPFKAGTPPRGSLTSSS